MFDYMIKILPNGRLLVRNSQSKTSDTINVKDLSSYLEKALESELEANDEKEAKEKEIREKALLGENSGI